MATVDIPKVFTKQFSSEFGTEKRKPLGLYSIITGFSLQLVTNYMSNA